MDKRAFSPIPIFLSTHFGTHISWGDGHLKPGSLQLEDDSDVHPALAIKPGPRRELWRSGTLISGGAVQLEGAGRAHWSYWPLSTGGQIWRTGHSAEVAKAGALEEDAYS